MRNIAIVLAWTLCIAFLVATGSILPVFEAGLLGIGAIGLVLGVVWFFANLWFLWKTDRVMGTVIACEREEGYYVPRVEATTHTGERIEFVSKSGRGSPEFEIGERVPVALNRASPEDSDIVSVFRMFIGPVVLTAISMAIFVGMLTELLAQI